MLEQLFGSKTRTKLLKIFLLNPDKAFFIRELTRMIDTQINSVRRELDNLLQCGIVQVVSEKENAHLIIVGEAGTSDEDVDVKKKDKTPKKFFTVNKNFVLHKELKNVFARSPLLFQEKFIKEIKALETIEYAFISGFFLETEAPVDLFIVGNVPKQKLSKLISSYEKEFEREINYSAMTSEEFQYRKSLTDRFLSRIFESKKTIIIDSIAVKLTS